MKIDEMHIELENGNAFIQTFGGEYDIDGFGENDYGLTIGDLFVSNIRGKQLAKLAVSAINHLMLNGHEFEFVKTGEQDLPVELRIKEQHANR